MMFCTCKIFSESKTTFTYSNRCMCPCVQSALEVYKEMLLVYLEEGRRQVNSRCAELEPWQIIGATFIITLGAVWIKGFLFQHESNLSHVMHG